MSNIIGWTLIVVLLFIAFYALLNIVKFLIMFHARRCKYCGHIMIYKKHHVDRDEDSYDFHCEHCGAWERVKREDMFNGEEINV